MRYGGRSPFSSFPPAGPGARAGTPPSSDIAALSPTPSTLPALPADEGPSWDGPTRRLSHAHIPLEAYRPATPVESLAVPESAGYAAYQVLTRPAMAVAADAPDAEAGALPDGEAEYEDTDVLPDRERGRASGRRVAPALPIAACLAAAVTWLAPARFGVDELPSALTAPDALPVLAIPPLATAAATPAPAPPAPAPDECRATITSRPAGAVVRFEGRTLGRTPVRDARIPCGATAVVLSRRRYAEAMHTLETSADVPARLQVRLAREIATLEVASAPAEAAIRINGRLVGRTPGSHPVPRYERLTVQVSAPGHRRWSQRLYLTAPATRIEARLQPAR